MTDPALSTSPYPSMPDEDSAPMGGATNLNSALSRYDLRLRSLDLERGEGIYLCSRCDGVAHWSVWLHTPEWMPEGGATYVLCTTHALAALTEEAQRA